jgi:hypothetical protein
MNGRAGGVGDEIDKCGLRPLAIELCKGGEHAAAEPDAGKGGARRFTYLLDGRDLRPFGARLPGFQVRCAGDYDGVELQPGLRNGRSNGRERRSGVGLVRNDDLHDDRRGNALGDLAIDFEFGEAAAVARIHGADDEARRQLAQIADARERPARLFRRKRNADVGD